MTLADKIIDLRKKMGWSQEQLAECMDISRQSVSKWESGASVPELDKIIKMSELFSVTTDYLLKEEISDAGEKGVQEEKDGGNVFWEKAQGRYEEGQKDTERKVTWEEAVTIMDLARAVSPKIALGVSLCVLSPVCLILLGAIAEYKSLLSEDMAGGIGLVVLLGFVAAGVGQFILYGMKMDKYEYLEKENIRISPEVRKLVAEKKEAFEPVYRKSVLAGVLLCICSVSPIFIALGFDAGDFAYSCCVCILLGIVAAGVYCFVRYGTIQGSFDKLLEEGDYTREKKAANKGTSVFSGIYWCVVVAIYLGVSFITNQWQIAGVVFVIAGILFPAALGILHLVQHRAS